MPLHFDDGTPFAGGLCSYTNRSATPEERLTRLFIRVSIEDQPTSALLDTGGAYLILNPEIAEAIELSSEDAVGTDHLVIRGVTVTGELHRIALTLMSDQGENVQVEVTAFVPTLSLHTIWDLPTYLGWHGCLERCRLAIDPATEEFYFGALD